MSALTAAQAMADGIHRVLPDAECALVPMADGGEGAAITIADALGGTMVTVPSHDALGRPITGEFGWVPGKKLAVVETASASGLEAIAPGARDAGVASSFGTGEIIKAALDKGAKHLILGLGGSATNDAGAGLFQALGVKFLDARGAEVPPGGLALQNLNRIDLSGLDPRLADCTIEAACDVDNPLVGPEGASAVFGPQKGADANLVAQLDAALSVWARAAQQATGRSVADLPGAGAAGGIGAALAAFTTAKLRTGVEIVIDAVGLRDQVRGADWVFTGEGGMDSQTKHGKTPWGVASVAAEFGKPVIAFAGKVGEGAGELLRPVGSLSAAAPGSSSAESGSSSARTTGYGQPGFVAIVPISQGVTDLATALRQGPANLANAAEMTTRLFSFR